MRPKRCEKSMRRPKRTEYQQQRHPREDHRLLRPHHHFQTSTMLLHLPRRHQAVLLLPRPLLEIWVQCSNN